MASSVGRLESRIWPGRNGPGPSTSSSPVESTPTRAGGKTVDLGQAQAGQDPQVAGREHGARLEDRLAGPQVVAGRPHVVAGRGRHLAP